MPRPYTSLKFKISLLFIISLQLWITGCGGPRTLPATYDSIRFTDKDVVEFNNRLTVMMQHNRNWNSIMRYVSSVVAIGAVASAGALGIAGVSTDIVSFTALGGGFIGDLQAIFKTRDRASAYQQGIDLMYEASDRYLHSRASTSNEVTKDSENNSLIPNDRLSKDAANLYTESIASLKLVEKALISQIPTVAEVQKATGKYKKFSVFPTQVSSDTFPDIVTDEDGSASTSSLDITVMEGGPVVSVASGNSSAISAKIKEGNTNQVVLTMINKAKLKKDIDVQLMSAQNVSATVTIKAPAATSVSSNDTGTNALNDFEKEITKDDIIMIQAHLKVDQTGKLDAKTRIKIHEIQVKERIDLKNGELDKKTYNAIMKESANPN